MSRKRYLPKGYHIDVAETDEAKIRNVIDYVSFAIGITIILSYFFFDDWLLELLFISIVLTSLKIAFVGALCNEAFKQERSVTNEEFARMHEKIESIKKTV